MMTVREVAEALELSPDTIKNSVKELWPDKMVNGKTTYLTLEEATQVKFNLRKNSQVASQPKTDLEMMLQAQEVMAYLNTKIVTLQQQLKQAQPAIDFHQAVAKSNNLQTLTQVAKYLGIGRKEFFDSLKTDRILYKDRNGDNVPYSPYDKNGYFKTAMTVIEHSDKSIKHSQIYVTSYGLEWLAKRYGNRNNKGFLSAC